MISGYPYLWKPPYEPISHDVSFHGPVHGLLGQRDNLLLLELYLAGPVTEPMRNSLGG